MQKHEQTRDISFKQKIRKMSCVLDLGEGIKVQVKTTEQKRLQGNNPCFLKTEDKKNVLNSGSGWRHEGTRQDYGTKVLAGKQTFPDNTITFRMIKQEISSIEADSSKSLEFCQVGEEE